MLPKIKKTIKAFLKDETGTISKANLIKGALFLSAAGVSVKKVKAGCKTYGATATGGDNIANHGDTVLEGDATTTWTCDGEPEFCTCTASGSTCREDHTNTGTMTHWSTDAKWHTNSLQYTHDKGNYAVKGYHGHHGAHANGDSTQGTCSYEAHSNHCNHASHCNTWMVGRNCGW